MGQKALLIKRYIFLILALACMLYIFCNSNEVATESAKRSEGVADKVTPIVVPGYETHEPPVQKQEKKMVESKIRNFAHAAEFAALGVFAVGFFMTVELKEKKQLLKMLFRGLAALLFCVVYAALDEVHQIFVAGRSCEFKDVLNDSLGATVGIVCFTLFVWLIDTLIKKRKNKNKNAD